MNLGNPDQPVGGLAVRTPPGVELRPLGRDDLAVALAMMREMYRLPGTELEPHRARFDAMVNSPDASPFLAVADGAPAGIALFWFRRRLGHTRFQGWLSDLYVRPAARGRGIARALLAACIAEWRLRQGDSIMLEVGTDNVAAKGLYASLGFRETGLHFQLRPIRRRAVAAVAGVTIRAMTVADFDAVSRLLGELGLPVPAEERVPALRRTLAAHLADPHAVARVAERDGEVVGMCTLVLREPFYMDAPQAWIPELVVAERARGAGIGALLLDDALATAAGRGAYACVLESGPQRRVAHGLYAAAGFTDPGVFLILAA
jgi:ribosomal protein S18 acetylase RimI-like enzyme